MLLACFGFVQSVFYFAQWKPQDHSYQRTSFGHLGNAQPGYPLPRSAHAWPTQSDRDTPRPFLRAEDGDTPDLKSRVGSSPTSGIQKINRSMAGRRGFLKTARAPFVSGSNNTYPRPGMFRRKWGSGEEVGRSWNIDIRHNVNCNYTNMSSGAVPILTTSKSEITLLELWECTWHWETPSLLHFRCSLWEKG